MLKRRSTLSSQKFAKERKKHRYILLVLLSILAIVVFCAAVYFSKLPSTTIQQITVEGNEVTPTKDIQDLVFSVIDQKYLGLFPKANSFIYPKEDIAAAIKKTWNRISDVRITIDKFTTLTIAVTEKKPEAVWCGRTTDDANKVVVVDPVTNKLSEQCYFVDSTGFIFSDSPLFSGDVFVKFYGAITGPNASTTPVGAQYLDTTAFKRFDDLSTLLRSNLNLRTISIFVKDPIQTEVILSNGIRLFLDNRLDMTVTLQKLKLFMDKNSTHLNFFGGSASPSTTSPTNSTSTQAALINQTVSELKKGKLDLDYIDLRYSDDIYYKTR